MQMTGPEIFVITSLIMIAIVILVPIGNYLWLKHYHRPPPADYREWAWYAGENEDEFHWGRYGSRAKAIGWGNGYTTEPGESFWIVEACCEDEKPDEDGNFQFVAIRNLKEVKSK